MKRILILFVILVFCNTAYAELWGSGSASTLIVQDAGDENATYYLGLWRAVAGALVGKTDGGITYNPSTNAFTITGDITVGSTAFDVDSANKTVGIGQAASATAGLVINRMEPDALADQTGLLFSATYGVGAANLDFRAAVFTVTLEASIGLDVDSLFGIKAFLNTGSSFDADITNVYGYYSEMEFETSGRGASIITNARHINILDAVAPGTADITTLMAFFAEQQTTGDTNWQIYSVGGANFFGGTDGIYLGQTDGAERIASDADGTLDLYAGTSIELHDATNIGDSTNEVQISGTGDVSFGGSAGFIYGIMDVPLANVITVDTDDDADPEEVKDDGTVSAGDGWESAYVNGTTFAVSDLHYITVNTPGTYEVIWDMSVKTNAAQGTVIHGGITVDTNTFQRGSGEGHAHVFNNNDDITICAVGIVDCPNGDEEISLWISNDAAQKTVVEHGNMRIMLIGGT